MHIPNQPMTLSRGNNNISNNNNQYHITPILLSMESIDTTYSSYLHNDMYHISLQIKSPWKHTIETVADTGANLNAISLDCAQNLYKQYIQKENRSFRVRTGGGYISCQEYITVSIHHQNNNYQNIKFLIIPDLPSTIS